MTRIAVVLACSVLALTVLAAPAGAHTLSKARAFAAAKARARSLAKRQAGETQDAHFTTPRCARRNVHVFSCTTTISGSSPCSPAETACDGPAPFAIPYRIFVGLKHARGSAVWVTARVD